MHVDAILIDDDPWVRSDWQDLGAKHSKNILVVGSLEELMPYLAAVRRDTPIFIDVELGGDLSGINVAHQLCSQGMTQLFLATAHRTIDVDELPFLRGIVGKEPPSWLISAPKPSRKLSHSEKLAFLQHMTPQQKELFDQRITDYENALYGMDGSLWLDGIGTHYPEDVLDVWERGIYENCGESELKQRIQDAWRESLGL